MKKRNDNKMAILESEVKESIEDEIMGSVR